MFYALIGLVALMVIALIGWGVAELKAKSCNYEQNQMEIDKRLADQLHKNGFVELGIKDVIKNISTKGFKTT